MLALSLLAHIALAHAAGDEVATVELFLLPHTHADVGWLQTVDSLSRMNVSRILDGVVGNLMNDTRKRRKFVWDEMSFLQLWWDNQATAQQQQDFTQLVKEKRIEFTDNGWSQHDMGCTTYDSMINNWMEGHLWIKAVLQALIGMEAWFFTRLSSGVVDDMKKKKGLEFVWRASSSLSDEESEIFCHVFESYYCMPLPQYAFEWGPDKGAKIPNIANIESLSKNLAKIATQRAAWFRTENVLIPWGCDYQYQNAELVYRSTDWLIDTINKHPEWGVHVQYTTPSEYLAAVQKSAQAKSVKFPVKPMKESFFPFNGWSGYFTSRPTLKGLSTQAHSALHTAETLYSMETATTAPTLWALLEEARRDAGVVQHHDAITGTECKYQEGCAGTDQVVGGHDVLGDYESMLRTAIRNANRVTEALLSKKLGGSNNNDDNDDNDNNDNNDSSSSSGSSSSGSLALSMDPSAFGKVLMGQGDGGEQALLVLHNPLASTRTEGVSIQVPVCNLKVTDHSTGAPVQSQVTAMFGISDGQAPYYDFSLEMVVTLPPLSQKVFVVSPAPDAGCHGGDFARHTRVHPASASDLGAETEGGQTSTSDERQQRLVARAVEMQMERTGGAGFGDPEKWLEILAEVSLEQQANATDSQASRPSKPPQNITLENNFLRILVDPTAGLQSVTDKVSGKTYSLTHDYVLYDTVQPGSAGDAYVWKPTDEARYVLKNSTGGKVDAEATTLALGPVMQEVRLQVSNQHKTRIRLWNTDDPVLGYRLELGHRIGVLEERTDMASRFFVRELSTGNSTLYAEDNGYEQVPHPSGQQAGKKLEPSDIPNLTYPSQMSVALADEGKVDVELAVALERSHGVSSLYSGTLDVIQHRRGEPYKGHGGTVVLDDTDRIFTQTWLSIGNVTAANRMRIAMKQQLNHPLTVLSTRAPADANTITNTSTSTDVNANANANAIAGAAADLPEGIHLQWVRATSASKGELMLRLQHLYAKGEDAQMSVPRTVDVAGWLAGAGVQAKNLTEVTLTGLLPKTDLQRQHFPAESSGCAPAKSEGTQSNGNAASTIIRPFELRTFLVEL